MSAPIGPVPINLAESDLAELILVRVTTDGAETLSVLFPGGSRVAIDPGTSDVSVEIVLDTGCRYSVRSETLTYELRYRP